MLKFLYQLSVVLNVIMAIAVAFTDWKPNDITIVVALLMAAILFYKWSEEQ